MQTKIKFYKDRVAVNYLAKDKKNIKTEKYYYIQAEKMAAADFSNRAKKRLELRDYLLEHPEEGRLSDLHHLFSRDVVKFFVDNQLITVLEREKKRSDAYFDVATTDFLDLNAEQAAVVEQVTSQIAQESNSCRQLSDHHGCCSNECTPCLAQPLLPTHRCLAPYYRPVRPHIAAIARRPMPRFDRATCLLAQIPIARPLAAFAFANAPSIHRYGLVRTTLLAARCRHNPQR